MLEPSSFIIELKYKCSCGTIHYLSVDEAKLGNKIYCDVCRKVNPVRPIESVKVLVNFKSRNSQPKNIENVFSQPVLDAHKYLGPMGYTKQSIADLQGRVHAKTKEDLIKEFLARQK